MKILHITQSLPGGPASYFEEIGQFQLERFGPDNVKFLIPQSQRQHIPSIPDLAVQTFRSSRRTFADLWKFSNNSISLIEDWQPDIVHLHSSFAGAAVRLRLMFRRKRPRIVYCAHGWSFLMDRGATSNYLLSVIERALCSVTDSIVNISQYEHDQAQKFGLPMNIMSTVLNGISKGAREISREEARDQLGWSSTGSHFLFVGRHDRQKGLDILLEEFSKIQQPDYWLHVVGAGVTGPTLIKNLDCHNVVFYDWVPREDLGLLYTASDVVVMPSRWEGFGLVAVEAMKHGRPVLASDRGALPEVIGPAGRICAVDVPNEFYKIMAETSRDDWDKLGKTASLRYLENFTSDRMNREILNVYAGV